MRDRTATEVSAMAVIVDTTRLFDLNTFFACSECEGPGVAIRASRIAHRPFVSKRVYTILAGALAGNERP